MSRRPPSRGSCVTCFRRRISPGFPTAPARILVAGCGTGRHPIGTARRFPDSSVLAVDLSLDEPCLCAAQDPRARNRQHRVPAGGPARAGSARRALRRRRLHRRAAPSRGSGRGLSRPAFAAPSGRRDARRALQRDGAPACRARAGIHCRARLRPDACRHPRLSRRDPRAAGRPAARAGGAGARTSTA